MNQRPARSRRHTTAGKVVVAGAAGVLARGRYWHIAEQQPTRNGRISACSEAVRSHFTPIRLNGRLFFRKVI